MFVFDFGKYAYLHHPDVICSLFKKKYTYLNRLVVVCFDFKKVCWLTSPRRCLFLILKSMLTGYLERDHLMGLCWHTFKKYADRLFRKRSSHGPMLAYLMLHLQVGIRTQTWTEIAILSRNQDIFMSSVRMLSLAFVSRSYMCPLFFLVASDL